jgi:hypothetical protein
MAGFDEPLDDVGSYERVGSGEKSGRHCLGCLTSQDYLGTCVQVSGLYVGVALCVGRSLQHLILKILDSSLYNRSFEILLLTESVTDGTIAYDLVRNPTTSFNQQCLPTLSICITVFVV